MAPGPQVRFLDDFDSNGADGRDTRSERDWIERWIAPEPRRGILLQIYSWTFGATILIALFTTVAWMFYPSATVPTPHPPDKTRKAIKVMVVGDSISQGHEGDYTWRYRLWEWFRASDHEDVTFVGPYNGTYPPPDLPRPPSWPPEEPSPGLTTRHWGGYAADVDPAWLDAGDNVHFAHWGRQGAQFRPFIEDAVREAQPDYVLFALGFNDLAWKYWPTDLVPIMQELVTKARAGKPDAKFAVGNVVQRTAYSSKPMLPEVTRMYNTLLEDAIPQWRTEESPVELVRMRESYECDPWGCPASHDGLHPNARGEYQIARAFARTLHEKYGLGSSNFTIPTYIPPRPCAPPTNLKAIVIPDAENNGTTPETATVHLSWDRFYGAFGYYWQNQVTGGNWAVLPGSAEESSVNKTGVGLGENWEMRVSTYCGDQQPQSNWSHVVSVST